MKPFLDSDSIEKIVQRISSEISHSYPKTEQLAVIAVGNDSLPFAIDLVNNISIPVEFDTLYLDVHSSTKGNLSIFHKLPHINISGKNVLVVCSCVRTGEVLVEVRNKLESMFDVNSIQFCSLLKERGSKSYINYLGSVIKNDLIPYGYGMTLGGLNMNIPDIYLDKVK